MWELSGRQCAGQPEYNFLGGGPPAKQFFGWANMDGF